MKFVMIGFSWLIIGLIIAVVSLYGRINTVEEDLKKLQDDLQLICMPDCPYYEGIEK